MNKNKKTAFFLGLMVSFLFIFPFFNILGNIEFLSRDPRELSTDNLFLANEFEDSWGGIPQPSNRELTTNVTMIGYGNTPRILVSSDNIVHMVTESWVMSSGDDTEILYGKFDIDTWSMENYDIEENSMEDYDILSDNASLWNTGYSMFPDIAIDAENNLHVVWSDNSSATTENDFDLYYTCYNSTLEKWSQVVNISDNSNNDYDGFAMDPRIAIDGNGSIYVVYSDNSTTAYLSDEFDHDIYCVKWDVKTRLWSAPMIVSDDGTYWNTLFSYYPDLCIDDEDRVHVVWEDYSPENWGTDGEILYSYFNATTETWSNIACISDYQNTDYNTNENNKPRIETHNNNIKITWTRWDNTPGVGANVMYKTFTAGSGVSYGFETLIGYYDPEHKNLVEDIIVDYKGVSHIIYESDELAENPLDTEIMHICNPGYSWKDPVCISDGWSGVNWSTGESEGASIAIGPYGDLAIMWMDYTNEFETYGTTLVNPAPTSNSPEDLNLEKGDEDQLYWTLSDDTGYQNIPYEIWVQYESETPYLWRTAGWSPDVEFNAFINKSVPGTFKYTIYFYDEFGKMGIPDEVIVTMVDLPPECTQPEDIALNVSDEEEIIWEISDDWHYTGQYRILNNLSGTLEVEVDWTTWTSNDIIHDINSENAGIFLYRIEYKDEGGNFGTADEVLVTINEEEGEGGNNNGGTTGGEIAGFPTLSLCIMSALSLGIYLIKMSKKTIFQ